MPERDGRNIIEALLFAAGESLTVRQLARLSEREADDVRRWVEELNDDYRERGGGLVIRKMAGGYELTTAPDTAPYVRRLFADQTRSELSTAALETLAIIAYRQPVTRGEIEAIRGVRVSGILANLIEDGLIRKAGREDAIGRPILYGTTRKFMEHFGLEELDQLPEVE